MALLPARAAAWGSQGHRIVARIAARHLTAETRTAVVKLLQADPLDSDNCSKVASAEEKLACVSTWADYIRRDKRFTYTSSQHFVDIPIYVPEPRRHYEPERDCPRKDCIVVAVEQYKFQLANPRESLPNRALALKFLVHLIGDLHEPLHTATGWDDSNPASGQNDLGGNRKLVRWFGQSSSQFGCLNLHEVWDNGIIERRDLKEDFYAGSLDGVMTKTWVAVSQRGDTVGWVNESYRAAIDYAYGKLPLPIPIFCGVTAKWNNAYDLDYTYYNATRPVVDMQLARAGVRLAKVLNDIFTPHARS